MVSVMEAARQVLREAFRLYARNWRALLMAAGLLLLPVTAIKAAAPRLAAWNTIPAGLRAGALASAGSWVLTIVQHLVVILTTNALVFLLARQLMGQPIDWRTSWRLGLGRARPAITAQLAVLLPMMGFAAILVLPAIGVGMIYAARHVDQPVWVSQALPIMLGAGVIFLCVRFAFVDLVAVIEQKSSFAAYGRNLDLLKGCFWRLAAVLAPIEIGRQLLIVAVRLLPLSDALSSAASNLVTWLVLPLETAATLWLYSRIRAEREGYDADQLGADLAPTPAPPPAAFTPPI